MLEMRRRLVLNQTLVHHIDEGTVEVWLRFQNVVTMILKVRHMRLCVFRISPVEVFRKVGEGRVAELEIQSGRRRRRASSGGVGGMCGRSGHCRLRRSSSSGSRSVNLGRLNNCSRRSSEDPGMLLFELLRGFHKVRFGNAIRHRW